MNAQQIEQLISGGAFPGEGKAVERMETHISWVLLSGRFAYKIKKPIQYPFLDFSTLEKRRYYCERELELNRRLTADMYLAVLPIRKADGRWLLGGEGGEVVDYAVQMRRQDTARQMNRLLERNEVTERDMRDLARQLARFHASATVIREPLNKSAMQDDFADIAKVQPFLAIHLGEPAAGAIAEAIQYSDHFLGAHKDRLRERIEEGFVIDGHGDLHSKNIFLPADSPAVIFDCIEFSDHFRQVDVLNELAFFCMDLDFYNSSKLAAPFLEAYFSEHPAMLTAEDQLIFSYYKLYRANVRVKVNALKTMQSPDEKEMKRRIFLVEQYLRLLRKYLSNVEAEVT